MTKMDIFSKQPDTSNSDNSGYEFRFEKVSNMQMNLRKATDHIPTPFLCLNRYEFTYMQVCCDSATFFQQMN